MTDDIIPNDVRQFLLENIDSITQWEGLLLMRARPEQEWSAQAVARNIYVGEPEIAPLLAQLAALGLLDATGVPPDVTYRYRPKSADLARMVEHAADLYKRYLIPVTNVIHSKSKTRIQEFADAFRIRKD